MRFPIIVIIISFLVISCRSSENESSEFASPQALTESLPTVQPAQVMAFSEVDTLFFGFIGADTIPIDDDSFALTDPRSGFVVQVDTAGSLVKKVAGQGRGPGEFLGGLFLQPRPNGGFTMYDQMNKKIGLFGPDAEYDAETVVDVPLDGITKAYDLGKDTGYLIEGTDFSLRPNAGDERKKVFSIVNEKANQIDNQVKVPAQPYVVLGDGGSATALPFAHRQLIRYKPQTQTFFSYWTGSDNLAEVNARFDTLNTIAVDIPAEQMNQAEIDTIENENPRGWEDLKDKLPNTKTSVLNMRLGPNNTYWLKLAYHSDFDQWLILDSQGTPQKIVQLPKNVMLTHVSKYYLGVRLGPGTFALYEPVE